MALMTDAAIRGTSRVNAAVEAIYDAAADPKTWPIALAAIAHVFGAKGTVLIFHRDDGRATAIVSPGLESAAADYDRYWGQHDLAVQRGHEHSLLSEVGVYTDRDVMTAEEIRTHPYYTDFRAKHGMKHFMGGSVSPHPNLFVGMGVQGTLGAAPFLDADVALLVVLARHIERALRLSIPLIEAEATNLTLGDALSRLRAGAIIVDENWRIVFANAAARTLAGGDELVAAH
jgi:GAF domain-containing protein